MRERGFKQQYPQADDDMIQIDGIDVGRMIINRQQLGIHIIDIVIFNNWRQRGIGSFLLNELCNEADEKQKIISLQVAFDNPALNLYQRSGFKTTGDQDVYRHMERQPKPVTGNTLLKGKTNE